VSIIGCTGDWFGGWDGLTPGSVDRLITADLQGGRLPEVIDRGEPAIWVCHWPGIYYNGQELGFKIFQEAVRRVHSRYENVRWMKLSEIARYWAAKELTRIESTPEGISLNAPFATDNFTLQYPIETASPPIVESGSERQRLSEVNDLLKLKPGTFFEEKGVRTICFDLSKGIVAIKSN